MEDHEPVELKEIVRSTPVNRCLLLTGLAVAAVVVAVLLRALLAMPGDLASSGDVTATPVPPTATSAPTHTPTHSPTPLPPPTPPRQGAPSQPRIITREEWGALEMGEGYVPHSVERITVHHDDGEPFYGGAVARLRGLQASSIQRGWVDIPYHFLIDLEGNIYEGRPLEFVGDTATEYDPTGHALITLMGNYEVQQVNEAQLRAIVDLATWLCYEHGIPPDLIRGHRDYAATACPGANLYQYLTNGYVAGAVEGRLKFANE